LEKVQDKSAFGGIYKMIVMTDLVLSLSLSCLSLSLTNPILVTVGTCLFRKEMQKVVRLLTLFCCFGSTGV
jgi:hypothetical protein